MVIEKDVRERLLQTVESMKKEIVQTVSDTVKIQSVNPLYPGIEPESVLGGERECNQLLKKVMEGFGCKTDMFEKAKQRTNLVGVLKGIGGGRSLIFNGHIDTVPLGRAEDWSGKDPLSGRVRDKRTLLGRGACDMKGGVVSMIKGVEAIRRAGFELKGDVTLESVVGEEVMSHELGVDMTVERGYKADAAINTEPSAPPVGLGIVPVTPGLWWMSITVEGKPVHTSVRGELIRAGGQGEKIGVNAIEKAVKVLQALQELEQQWGITKNHPLFQPGHFTIHPGVITGGPYGAMVPFIVSQFCTIEYAIWHHPNESANQVKKEIEDYVLKACELDPWLQDHPPKFQWKLWWPPSKIDSNHPIAKVMASAHELATGEAPKYQGFAAVCDAAFLNNFKIPTVIYGPGDIKVAHSIDEYVNTPELVDAAKSYALAALEWCGYRKK